MHRPCSVSEVVPDRAKDHRPRIGNKRRAVVRRISIDSHDQSDGGGLVEILERLAAPLVKPREPPRKRQEPDDDRLTRVRVSGRGTVQQLSHIARPPIPRRRDMSRPMRRHMQLPRIRACGVS